MGDSATDQDRDRRSRPLVRVLKGLASVALGWALLVGVMPRFADLGEVWAIIDRLTLPEVGLLALVSAWNILTYQFVMMSALPGLKLRHAFMTGQISTAVSNTVPAGSVVGIGVTYGVLSSFGHQGTRIARASVLTGWWNTLAKLAFPTAALFFLAMHGSVNEALLTAAGVGLVILIGAVVVLLLVVSSEGFARRAGELLQRVVNAFLRLLGREETTGWPDSFADFRAGSSRLLRRRWHVLSLATILSHTSLFMVLITTLRLLGVPSDDVHWYEALGAFAFVQLATAVPITPGGLGLVEVGLSAALVVAGGERSAVVAAVLLYRALTYLLQVGLGVISYLVWKVELRVARSQAPTG